MNQMALFFIGGILLLFGGRVSNTMAQNQQKTPVMIGWNDQNKDGKNDVFRDANGDGINDVTGRPYPHQFQFIDKNRDGINDVFKDANGDGLNDYGFKSARAFWFIDANGDGINDVTGEPFDVKHFAKQQKELSQKQHPSAPKIFLDENGDGIDDRLEAAKNSPMKGRMRKTRRGRMDRFIDEDGDGIADHRMDRLRFHPIRPATAPRGPHHGGGHP